MTTFINYQEQTTVPAFEKCDAFRGVVFENNWKYTGEYFREDGNSWYIVANGNITRAVNASPTFNERG